mmetsp:Transcript_4227/g.10060  ORF Transcript_4227/g.10060 Transcript_4227/m.10060 type:complete len:221 (-) Transcript_4227:1932-2594(-)
MLMPFLSQISKYFLSLSASSTSSIANSPRKKSPNSSALIVPFPSMSKREMSVVASSSDISMPSSPFMIWTSSSESIVPEPSLSFLLKRIMTSSKRCAKRPRILRQIARTSCEAVRAQNSMNSLISRTPDLSSSIRFIRILMSRSEALKPVKFSPSLRLWGVTENPSELSSLNTPEMLSLPPEPLSLANFFASTWNRSITSLPATMSLPRTFWRKWSCRSS